MSTFRRIGIGCLVGLCFAVGYGARLQGAAREEAILRAVRRPAVSAPGVSVAAARLEGAGNIDLRPLEVVWTVLKSLREHYVDQISPTDEGKMTYDSLRAMLASLNDPHTRFLDPAQRKLVTEAAAGRFHGIGVVLGVKKVKSRNLTEEHLIVIAPVATGPAATAGVKPGDDIVAVNGRDVLPFNPYQKATEIVKEEWNKKAVEPSEAKKHLKAEQKRIEEGIPLLEAEDLLVSGDQKEVELAIVRKGSAKQIKVKIAPRAFAVEPVASSFLENETLGYVKVNCLSAGTGERFQAAIRDLRSKGAKGLVLDLRDLVGGGLEPVLDVARPLLSGKLLAVERRSRDRRSAIKVAECAEEDSWRGPIVVLVNSGTARMSEVLAAALRDSASARLVGEKTYGDFTVATLIDQRDGSAVEMTTGMLVPPKSGDYQGKGLPVDVAVASSASGDPQLDAAIKLLAGPSTSSGSTLRPAQGSGSAATTHVGGRG